MKPSDHITHRLLISINRLAADRLDYNSLMHLLNHELGAIACIFLAGETVLYTEGLNQDQTLAAVKRQSFPSRFFSDELAFAIPFGRNEGRARFFFRAQHKLKQSTIAEIQDLLILIGRHLTTQRLNHDRIVESQMINELNLNIITTMDVRKIIRQIETTARKMTGVNDLHLFCIMNGQILSVNRSIKIQDLPRTTYQQIQKSRQIAAISAYRFHPLLPAAATASYLLIPYTIKNEPHGFFLFRNQTTMDQSQHLTRLKFLANQAALAMERIELFSALRQALEESHNLQDIIRLMLNSVNLPSFLHELLKRAQQLLGFKKILCSLYNPQTSSFDRLAGVGISNNKFRAARHVHPPLKEIKLLLQDKFRICNSYYIPAELIGRELKQYELYHTPRPKPRSGNRWLKGDIFLHPVYAQNREFTALLSLDEPVNGLIPDLPKAKLLATFGDFLGLMIEKNQLFTSVNRLSQTDEMTGLYNYRFIQDKVRSLIADRVSPIAFVFLDLNNFKSYNDRYGHLSGDEVLKNFSRLLIRAVHAGGFAARYGGDEFVLILPRANRRSAEVIVASVKMAASADPIAIPITFCHGISIYPHDGQNLGDLLDHADRLLYQQKVKL